MTEARTYKVGKKAILPAVELAKEIFNLDPEDDSGAIKEVMKRWHIDQTDGRSKTAMMQQVLDNQVLIMQHHRDTGGSHTGEFETAVGVTIKLLMEKSIGGA